LHRLSVGRPLGNEARLFRVASTQQGTKIDVYVVAWRSGAVKESLIAAGLSGTVVASDVVSLAARQQRHIAGH
jgi:hypothetical protein